MRILIVDDDTAIVEVIRDTVNWDKLGIDEIDTAYDAEAAKHRLEQKAADIVISDIEMPGESGLDLLKWFRDKEMPGKFLLLTSHENFHYATQAVRYHAEEYLMKPFNLDVVEMALQKIAGEIRKEWEQHRLTYEEWAERNRREVKRVFWMTLFSGSASHTQKEIQRELDRVSLAMDQDKCYRLVTSRVTNMETDIETYGRELVMFMLENMHSELLCGTPESEDILSFEQREYGSFVVICEEMEADKIKGNCEELIRKIENLLECTLTCCISRPCTMDEFYTVYHANADLLSRNIVYYGEAFCEEQAAEAEPGSELVLKLSQMEEYLEARDKKAFLDFLKRVMNVEMRQKFLNREMLKRISGEIQQAVYTHLAKQGIQVSQLLGDETSLRIMGKADQSVVDMLRWVNYLLDRVFDYEEEIKKSQTIIEKINLYIRDHYKEDIGRNEIGASFYLAPEYLAKMYKKKTGKNLKDYINEYRLEKAKEFLSNEGVRVSDAAAEVGFSNFSYFSTLFKKYTGMTPNEFRRKWETGAV
ncbi:MAG: response regulator [Lachnospiraceae bacterium]|nr:response regulator [Lachnospiraceae bacterium]